MRKTTTAWLAVVATWGTACAPGPATRPDPSADLPVVAPSSSGAPSVVPAASATPRRITPPGAPDPSAPLAAGQCRTDADCGSDRYCQRPFNGAVFLPGLGSCIDERPVYE
ncbi:MAG: hypothetical protein AAF928_06120 [Myxococcota bacterium]